MQGQVVEDSISRAEGRAGQWKNPSSSKTERDIIKQIYVQWTYFVDAHLSSIFRPKQGAWMQGMQGMQGPKQGALASPLSPPLANSRAPTSVAAADTTSPYIDGDPLWWDLC